MYFYPNDLKWSKSDQFATTINLPVHIIVSEMLKKNNMEAVDAWKWLDMNKEWRRIRNNNENIQIKSQTETHKTYRWRWKYTYIKYKIKSEWKRRSGEMTELNLQ